MEAQELRQFGVTELEGRVRQWREELFRARFAASTSEKKDTSVFRKLRRDIARALTIINQKKQGREFQVAEGGATPAPQQEKKAAKTVAASTAATAAPETAGDKPATEKKAKASTTKAKKKTSAEK